MMLFFLAKGLRDIGDLLRLLLLLEPVRPEPNNKPHKLPQKVGTIETGADSTHPTDDRGTLQGSDDPGYQRAANQHRTYGRVAPRFNEPLAGETIANR